MENKINPKPNQDDTDSKTSKGLPPLSVREGTKPQDDNRQTSDKKKDSAKNKFKIAWRWFWEKVRQPKLTDWIVALATVAIFITSVLQWKAIHGQWGEMKSASRQTNKLIDAAENMVKSTQKSIAQGKEALDSSIEMARRDQRAWVGPVEAEPPKLRDPDNNLVYIKEGSPARFIIWVTNSGKSPALKVKAQTWMKLIPSDMRFFPEYGKYPEFPRQSIVVIQVQARYKINFTLPQPITISDIDTIKKGKGIFYLYGKITYEDIFKKPHWTTFCMFLAPSLDGFTHCDTYNEVD